MEMDGRWTGRWTASFLAIRTDLVIACIQDSEEHQHIILLFRLWVQFVDFTCCEDSCDNLRAQVLLRDKNMWVFALLQCLLKLSLLKFSVL